MKDTDVFFEVENPATSGYNGLKIKSGEQVTVKKYDTGDATYSIIYQDRVCSCYQSDFILMPSKEFIASLSDTELLALAAILNKQYNDLYNSFVISGGSLNLTGTGETDEQTDGNNYWLYERTEPKCTFNQVLKEFHQYFAEDKAFDSYLAGYLKEKNGFIWRLSGYGGPGREIKYKALSIKSRSDSEIVFNMKLTIQNPGQTGNQHDVSQTVFALRLENDMWKCSKLEAFV